MPADTLASLVANPTATTAAPPAATPAPGTTSAPAPGATPAPAATSAPAASGIVWPEAQRALAEKYQGDPIKILGALDSAQKLIGADKATVIALPKEGDTVAQAELWNKLGRPESPAGYKLEGDIAKDPAVASAREAGHALGLTQAQFAGFAKWFSDSGAAAIKAQEDAFAADSSKGVAELKASWGAGYQKQMDAVRATAQKLGFTTEELDKMERAVGTKAMLEKFAAAGAALIEKRGVDGAGIPGESLPMTPDQATAELKAIAKDKDFQRRLMAGDMEAQKRVKELTAYRAGYLPGDYQGLLAAGRGGERIGRV
jgi:hypothetical protein